MRRMGHPVAADSHFVDSSDRSVGRASLGSLFVPEFRRDTIALWGAFFSCLLGVYLGFSWLTSLLTGAGFDPGTANTGITAFNLGGVVGAVLGGMAIARFGSRAAMLTMTGVAIAAALGLSAMTISPAVGVLPIIAMLTLTGSMINGVQTTMYALAAHVYRAPCAQPASAPPSPSGAPAPCSRATSAAGPSSTAAPSRSSASSRWRWPRRLSRWR